ncbi:MAG: methylmalonyl Co-A mutase-associated GTPase MeaB [Gemmatimonadota bacterium]
MNGRSSIDDLLEGIAGGRALALSRAISLVENQRPGFERLLHDLHGRLGGARRIGITGPPGAGKSTLTAALARRFREAGETVGILAVDPSSPFTGGALLGDRIRMNDLATEEGIFIRSMATRGSHGGLSATTREATDLLDAFGFDRILLETVGVGQSELKIASQADSTVVVLVPESGDGIQAMKAGLMEVADLFVINKADRPGADRLRKEIRIVLHLREGGGGPRGQPEDGWSPPILTTVASEGEGVEALAEGLDRHHSHLAESGELEARRRAAALEHTRAVLERTATRWAADAWSRALEVDRDPLAGGASPYEAARRIAARIRPDTVDGRTPAD